MNREQKSNAQWRGKHKKSENADTEIIKGALGNMGALLIRPLLLRLS